MGSARPASTANSLRFTSAHVQSHLRSISCSSPVHVRNHEVGAGAHADVHPKIDTDNDNFHARPSRIFDRVRPKQV